MKFRVSSASERLVGRLEAGEDLVDVLTQLCEDHGVAAGQIRAVGHFDAVKLVYYDADVREYRPVVDGEGSFELVGLTGNVSRLGGEVALRLDAVLNAVGPEGPRTIGGQLRYARAVDAEFVVETFPDLEMERSMDDETGRLVLDSVERRPGAGTGRSDEPAETYSAGGEDEAGDQGSMSWDEAIAETEETEQRRNERRSSGPSPTTGTVESTTDDEDDDPYAGFDFDEPMIAQGDILEHPKLGKCKILQVEGDDHVKIRMPGGRVRKLMLGVLEINYRGEEEGKRVFEARVK